MQRLTIHPLSLGLIFCALSAACIGVASCKPCGHPMPPIDCQIGAYRFPDGEIVDIARSEGENAPLA